MPKILNIKNSVKFFGLLCSNVASSYIGYSSQETVFHSDELKDRSYTAFLKKNFKDGLVKLGGLLTSITQFCTSQKQLDDLQESLCRPSNETKVAVLSCVAWYITPANTIAMKAFSSVSPYCSVLAGKLCFDSDDSTG